jgi:hypothetical protein
MVHMLPAYPSPASAATPSGPNNPFMTLASAPGGADEGGLPPPLAPAPTPAAAPDTNGSLPPIVIEV